MSDSSKEVRTNSIVATLDLVVSLDRPDDATKASEKTIRAIESTIAEEDLMGVAIIADGDALKVLVIEGLDPTEDDNAHMGVENEDLQLQSDTWVSLGPEGIAEPVELAKDMSNGEDRRMVHTRFQEAVMFRTYILGSVPNPRRRNTTLRPQPSTVLESRTQLEPAQPPPPPLDDEEEGRLEIRTRLEECEEELDVLERILPAHSNDPNFIKWTQLTIGVARETIKDARQTDFWNRELVDFAFQAVAQAYGFQEEALRRVNARRGPSDYKSFEAEAVRRESGIQLRRADKTVFLRAEVYGDLPDNVENEEQDKVGNEEQDEEEMYLAFLLEGNQGQISEGIARTTDGLSENT